MKIYCCGCKKEVEARLTNGKEVFPSNLPIKDLPFWKCDVCRNFVGCHYKTNKPHTPLGCIPTKEIKACRKQIHVELEPYLKSATRKIRFKIFGFLSKELGYDFSIAEIKTIDEGYYILDCIKKNSKYFQSL